MCNILLKIASCLYNFSHFLWIVLGQLRAAVTLYMLTFD